MRCPFPKTLLARLLTPQSRFRPYVVPVLFESLGAPCTQCGRRFKNDEQGKKKKTAHMDWHFKVNQRIAEADKAGQSRSWLVDETVSHRGSKGNQPAS